VCLALGLLLLGVSGLCHDKIWVTLNSESNGLLELLLVLDPELLWTCCYGLLELLVLGYDEIWVIFASGSYLLLKFLVLTVVGQNLLEIWVI
jgi:hypothetical protein